MNEWQTRSKNLLKAELERKGLNYIDLVNLLEAIGISYTYKQVSSRIGRGTFSFEFFLQCMKAIGTTSIRLEY